MGEWTGPGGRSHSRISCQEYEEIMGLTDAQLNERKSLETINKITKPCAYCKVPIQKNLGCNHMTCLHCGGNWCWTCDTKLGGRNRYQSNGHWDECAQFS